MENVKKSIESLLREGKTVQFPPTGWSMYPTIVYGRDQAVVEPIEGREPRRGDVILYRRDNSILVLHRVWRVKDGMYYTVGDNQAQIEGPLRPDQLRGIMTALVRKGKTVPVNALRYRLPSRFWLLLRPIRMPLSRFFAAIKRRLKKRA